MNVDRNGKFDVSELKFVAHDVDDLRINQGDVLFNNTNSPELIGKTTTVSAPGEWAFSNHMTRLRPPADISSRFVAYQLHYLWMSGYFRHRCTNHVNQASIAASTLANSVPLIVAPTHEQNRIVAEIEKQFTRLDDAVAALKRVQVNLKRYRASVLKTACEGRLVPTEAELARKEGRSYEPASELLKRILAERRAKWGADYHQTVIAAGKPPKDDNWKKRCAEPATPDANALPRLLDGWTWATLDQLSTRITKGSSPGWQGFEYQVSGIPFIRSQNVLWGELELSDMVFLEQRFNDEHSGSIIREGDVLLNIVGASIGRSAIATALDEANCNQAVAIIRTPAIGKLNRFLMYQLIGPETQHHVHHASADVARANFNLDDIKPTPGRLPPLQELERIVNEIDRRFSGIANIESIARHLSAKSAVLRGAILRSAFSGKLVPQDANDEPASALLERIRAERAAALATKNGNQKTATETRSANTQRRRRVVKLAQRVSAGKG